MIFRGTPMRWLAMISARWLRVRKMAATTDGEGHYCFAVAL
jgi:hypothetical protein